MNLHEYQAKRLFAEYRLPVSTGVVLTSPREAEAAVEELGGSRWVVKAQIHAGGRGKAGGVRLVESVDEIKAFAKKWLGRRMVTYQTDKAGQPVNQILLDSCVDISRELYFSATVDRASARVVFIVSAEGGVEIEEVAAKSPDKILRAAVDPLVGAQPYQARNLAFSLGLTDKQVRQFTDIFLNAARLFEGRDLALLEINPLVITDKGDLFCLDAKINLDGNALYRQEEILSLRDFSQEDERESKAARWGLSYVALDGNIGCMVNGAGLAMGTMDIITLCGGAPANFLDVGGGATSERVAEAFKIILSDKKVRAVLINIFGGIVRCDLIAKGIIQAVKEVGVRVPVVVRLEGNSAGEGAALLAKSGLDILAVNTLEEAAKKVVASANG